MIHVGDKKARHAAAQSRYLARKRGENVPLHKMGPPKGRPLGERTPRWKGESVSDRGGRSRALRMYPEAGTCSVCGGENAERHHIDENTANNIPENIAFLCRRCHMAGDGRLEAFIAMARRGRA